MSSSSHPSVDIKFDFVPFNGTPGETYDKWERALLNAGAKADDRGYSISDHFTGVDEGTAANPHPAGPDLSSESEKMTKPKVTDTRLVQ